MKIFHKRIGRTKDTFHTCLRLLKIVWKVDKWLFTAMFIAVLIPAVIPFINIYIYKLVIDLVVSVISGTQFDPAKFYPLIGLRIITYFIQDAAFRTQGLLERLMWTKVPIELNQMLFKKISSLDIFYFEDDKFRNLLEKVRESYDFRPQRVVSGLMMGFQSVLQVNIAFVALVNLNWFFSILIMVVSIPEFINQSYQSKLAFGIWNAESQMKKRYGYLSHLLQHPKEVKEIKMFKLADMFLSELKGLQQKFYDNNKNLAKRNYWTGLVFNVLSAGAFIGIEVYVIFQALIKKVTVGDINFYTGVVSNFQNGLGGLLRNINEVFDSSLYIESIFEVLDTENVVIQKDQVVKLDLKKAPVIEFKNVTFSYPGSKRKILNNFSLIISPGEKIAFVGENGAGKSTIIKLLARLYDVDKGEILINGQNLKDLELASWYMQLGVLFQDFNRYEDPVKSNIYFGDISQELDIKKVIEASVSSGADRMVRNFDKGYEQMLGRMFEGGIELSGGQWQKIALARAFFRNAQVLILDEPTASIDAKAEAEIFNKVEKLSKDKTVIIISHRFSTVRNADKIYVIDKGKIVENGTHEELMKNNGQYATLFKLQAKGYQ